MFCRAQGARSLLSTLMVAEHARDGKPRRPAPELAAFRESDPRPSPKSSPKSKSKSEYHARPKKRAPVKKFQKKKTGRPSPSLPAAPNSIYPPPIYFHRSRRRARTSHAGPSADSNSPAVQTSEEGRITSIAARTTAIRPRPFRSFARHSGCRARAGTRSKGLSEKSDACGGATSPR